MALRPLMTDSELKHRKRLQSKVSVVGSTLGLAALGAKGVGSAAPKIGRLGARGAGIKQRADKVTEAGLIGSAGVGGLGGYNFAAIQNAESRKRPRQSVHKAQKRKSLEHEANKVAGGTGLAAGGAGLMAAGYTDLANAKHYARVGTGFKNKAERYGQMGFKPEAVSTYAAGHAKHLKARKLVRSGNIKAAVGGATLFGGTAVAAHGASKIQSRARRPVRKEAPAMLDFGLGPVKQGSAAREEEIAKLGSAKVRMQQITNMNRDAPTDTMEAHYKGKSAILRRPKYQAVAYSSKSQHGDLHGVTPNYRMKAKHANTVHQTYQSKKKKIDFGEGGGPGNFIRKAYDPEANRQKNMNRAATAFAAGSGALAAGAALTGKKAYKPLKAMAGTKRGSAALKNGGKTAVLGAGSFGAAVTSDRILGHKNGRGGRYRPLRERGF